MGTCTRPLDHCRVFTVSPVMPVAAASGWVADWGEPGVVLNTQDTEPDGDGVLLVTETWSLQA